MKTKTIKPKIVLRPWKITPRSRYIVVSRDGKRNICKVYNARGKTLESEAYGNAVLIEHAPFLYAVLNDLSDALDATFDEIYNALHADVKGIKKLDVAYARAKVLRLKIVEARDRGLRIDVAEEQS